MYSLVSKIPLQWSKQLEIVRQYLSHYLSDVPLPLSLTCPSPTDPDGSTACPSPTISHLSLSHYISLIPLPLSLTCPSPTISHLSLPHYLSLVVSHYLSLVPLPIYLTCPSPTISNLSLSYHPLSLIRLSINLTCPPPTISHLSLSQYLSLVRLPISHLSLIYSSPTISHILLKQVSPSSGLVAKTGCSSYFLRGGASRELQLRLCFSARQGASLHCALH